MECEIQPKESGIPLTIEIRKHKIDKPKTQRGCSRRQLFRHYRDSSEWRNNRQNKEAVLRKRLLTLSHIGVVFMSFKVNFDVGRSAVQIAMCLPGIFLLIRSSLDSSFSGIFVCGPLFIWNPESKFHRQGIPNQSVELRIRDCHGAKSPFRNSKASFKETHSMSDPFKDSGISTHPSTNPKLTLITTCLRQNVELGEG